MSNLDSDDRYHDNEAERPLTFGEIPDDLEQSQLLADQPRGIEKILILSINRLFSKEVALLVAALALSQTLSLPFLNGIREPGQSTITPSTLASANGEPRSYRRDSSSPTPNEIGEGNYQKLSNKFVWIRVDTEDAEVRTSPTSDGRLVGNLKPNNWYLSMGLLRRYDKISATDLCLVGRQDGSINYATCETTTTQGRIANVSYSDEYDGELRETYLPDQS